MATESNEQGNQVKSRNYDKHQRNHLGKKIEPVRSYLSNGRHQTDEKRRMGIMEGTSRTGRPNREWLDDIKEWCQEDIYILSRKVHDRDLWRQTVNYDRDLWRQTVNYAVNNDGPME